MIVKQGETKRIEIQNDTIDGLMFNIYLEGDTVNTPLVASDFNPSEITLNVKIIRGKQTVNMVMNNLQQLGLYHMLQYGNHNWFRGNVLNYPDADEVEQKLYSLFNPFGGPLNLKGADKVIAEVTLGRATFGANVEAANSYLEFKEHTCVGYEIGIPVTDIQVVQANIPNETYSFGDYVTKVMFLNFDIDNIETNVITNCSLSSDKLDFTDNFYDLLNRHWSTLVPPNVEYRYGNAQGAAGLAAEAFPFIPKYPQSVCIFASDKERRTSLNRVQVSCAYNKLLVNAGMNYWCATRFIVTAQSVAKAAAMATKHGRENAARLTS